MQLDEYISKACLTESNDFGQISWRFNKRAIRLLHGVMGLVTETVELSAAMAKLDRTNIAEEYGDHMWYVAVVCDELGVSQNDFSNHPYSSRATMHEIEGDMMDALKRHLFYGAPLDVGLLRGSILDICHNLFDAMLALDLNPYSVMEGNIAKLQARYPDRFNQHDAVSRNLEAERAILESHDADTARQDDILPGLKAEDSG